MTLTQIKKISLWPTHIQCLLTPNLLNNEPWTIPPSKKSPFPQSQWYSYYHLTWTNSWTSLKSPYQKNQKLPSLPTTLCLQPHCLVSRTHWWIHLPLSQVTKEHHQMHQNQPKTNTTPTETPLSLTTIQQLDELYPNKVSYLSFWTKVIHEPSFTTLSLSSITQTPNSDERETSFLP